MKVVMVQNQFCNNMPQQWLLLALFLKKKRQIGKRSIGQLFLAPVEREEHLETQTSVAFVLLEQEVNFARTRYSKYDSCTNTLKPKLV
jgi:hypothetical protein